MGTEPGGGTTGPKPAPLARQLREQRWETVASGLESVALRLFDERGFANVTVEEIASQARISPRTFYRYCGTKEDLLQLRISRRSAELRTALASRSPDEPPLDALRSALEQVLGAEDPELVRRWTRVVSSTPGVLRSVIGGIQLKAHRAYAEFFGHRLGLPFDGLVPTMLAAAVGGVVQAGQTHWYFYGGDLATTVSQGLGVLERAFGGDLGASFAEEDGDVWPA